MRHVVLFAFTGRCVLSGLIEKAGIVNAACSWHASSWETSGRNARAALTNAAGSDGPQRIAIGQKGPPGLEGMIMLG